MTEKGRDRLVKAAPKLRDQDIEAINAHFQHYIFRRRKTREVWTTCCHRHEVLPKGHPILDAEHVAGPEKYEEHYHYTCGTWRTMAPPKRPPKVACPFCGAEADVKELGRTGHRKGLHEWTRGVVLRQYRGALYALAYNAGKGYLTEAAMLGLPSVYVDGIYRFRPGLAEYARRDWWYEGCEYYDYGKVTVPPGAKLKRMIREPFNACSKYGLLYDVVGLEELDRSDFRYCQLKQYVSGKHRADNLIRLLALCTQWPRQVEMLTKAGLETAVEDLIDARRWNAAILNWREPDPIKSMGLTREELREFQELNKAHHAAGVELLRRYKALRNSKARSSMRDVLTLIQTVSSAYIDRVVPRLKWCGLQIPAWLKYIKAETTKTIPENHMVELWVDYIDAAEGLGYDLSNRVFSTPKGLPAKHDEAIAAAGPIRQEQERKRAGSYGRNSFPKLMDRYGYEDDHWLIRAPYSALEIRNEGKALCHCVGGYADRHVKGKTTILFLRDKRKPDKSLVTIEMSGNTIVQIHGYKDDMVACKANPKRIPPRKLYADILDPWLAWLAAGSKRDKDGRPKLPKKKKEVTAA